MSNSLTRESYVFTSDLMGRADWGVLGTKDFGAAMTKLNLTRSVEAYNEFLKEHDPEAAVTLSGVVRAISHLDLVTPQQQKLPVAVLDTEPSVAIVGTLDRLNHFGFDWQKTTTNGVYDGGTTYATQYIRTVGKNIKMSKGDLPEVEELQKDFSGIPIDHIKFDIPSRSVLGDKPNRTEWACSHNTPSIIVVGDAVGRALIRNGYESAWDAYCAVSETAEH